MSNIAKITRHINSSDSSIVKSKRKFKQKLLTHETIHRCVILFHMYLHKEIIVVIKDGIRKLLI